MPARASSAPITLQRLVLDTITLNIVSTAPLIQNRFSEEEQDAMLAGMMGEAHVRGPKDPDTEYQRCFHLLPDGKPGIPAIAFKRATTDGARYFPKITAELLKRAIFIKGTGPNRLVPIKASEPWMRRDVVRVANGAPDLRFRPQYDEWSAELVITFLPSMIAPSALVALVDAGGLSGVGELRPGRSSSGVYGTYQVKEGS